MPSVLRYSLIANRNTVRELTPTSPWCVPKLGYHVTEIGMSAGCVSDHFIWTHLASVWWMVVGVSSVPNVIGTDLPFKRVDRSMGS